MVYTTLMLLSLVIVVSILGSLLVILMFAFTVYSCHFMGADRWWADLGILLLFLAPTFFLLYGLCGVLDEKV